MYYFGSILGGGVELLNSNVNMVSHLLTRVSDVQLFELTSCLNSVKLQRTLLQFLASLHSNYAITRFILHH